LRGTIPERAGGRRGAASRTQYRRNCTGRDPAFEASLDRLGLDYLDLYLSHTHKGRRSPLVPRAPKPMFTERHHEAAVAAIAQAASALSDAKLQLSYTEVRSPVAGRVGRKSVEAGQRLQRGQRLLAIVEDDLWVVANYKETQLTRMKPGHAVEIPSTPSRITRFEGTLIACRRERARSSLYCRRTTQRETSRRLSSVCP